VGGDVTGTKNKDGKITFYFKCLSKELLVSTSKYYKQNKKGEKRRAK